MTLIPAPVRIPLQNILVPTDFSPVSLDALRFALPIAKRFHSTVHLVHVTRSPELGLVSPAVESDIEDQADTNAWRRLKKLEAEIHGVSHRAWLREGDVWSAVEDVVQSEHIDLIVVGSSGKSDLKKFFVGSVMDEILRSARCPVLVFGPHVRKDTVPERLSQLLYVTDILEESHHGLDDAVSLAIENQAQLMILHVVNQKEPRDSDHQWLKEFRRMLHNLLPDSAAALSAEPVLRVEVSKHPVERILQVADEINADLIVMEVPPEEAWATHLRDKVSEIISCAKCPVFAARTVRVTDHSSLSDDGSPR